MLASGEAVKKYGLKPMAKLVGWGQGGVDPKVMGVGPVPASRQAMEKAGLTIEDMDLVEAVTTINQNIKPLRDFLAVSRGYADWIEFRAVATARQNRALAFGSVYDEED